MLQIGVVDLIISMLKQKSNIKMLKLNFKLYKYNAHYFINMLYAHINKIVCSKANINSCGILQITKT